MKIAIFGATAAAAMFVAGVVSASPISISVFSTADYDEATKYEVASENFENTGLSAGILGGPLSTSVGVFDTLGGTGSGSTCQKSLGDPVAPGTCTKLALFDSPVNGQGNIVPDDGKWSLNANDTLGISWDVKLADDKMFNRVVFAIMDAGDQGATVSIKVADVTEIIDFVALLGQQKNNANQLLIVVDFMDFVSKALIEVRSVSPNDSISLDGASVGVVPIPAAGFLLLGGLGALGAAARRKRKAA